MVVSPDGKNLADVAGSSDNALAVFSLGSNGLWSFTQSVSFLRRGLPVGRHQPLRTGRLRWRKQWSGGVLQRPLHRHPDADQFAL